jgi:molybdopterin-guanine dinucleotide biosynthesis protein A
MRGPLSGLLSSIGEARTPWVFACAGDAPFVDAALIDMLEARIESGDEAVVPRRVCDGETQIEPLAALYLGAAFLREGLPVLTGGNGALRMVIDRLKTRFVDVDDEKLFTNVNTPDDYAAIREVL